MKEICSVVLAAGLGTRLMPLTKMCPKALVPVGNVPLLDRSLDRLAAAGFSGKGDVAVNAHHHAGLVAAHVGERAHLSIEDGEPLGSAGALGHLRDWIDGRSVLVVNADAYVSAPPGDLLRLLDGWDGERVRLLGRREDDGHPPFGGLSFAGASLIPAAEAARLKDEYSHLVLTTWRPAERTGRLDAIELDGTYIDCGTPADYLDANMHAAGGENVIDATASVSGPVRACVIGARARVAGAARRSVVWPDAEVGADETLSDVIRAATGVTVEATRA
jgi:N-acetyl-alpha-D-muramate 1-phosphate uridylyltransferase